MNLKDKIVEAQIMPKAYFNHHISQITYTDSDDIDDVITLLVITAFLEEAEVFTKLLTQVERKLKKQSNDVYIYYYYLSLASFSKHNEDLISALDYCMKSNDIAYNIKDRCFIVESLRFMSSIYRSNNDSEMAIYYCEGAIKELVGCNNFRLEAHVYMLYGIIYVDSKDYDNALKVYNKALNAIHNVDNYEMHVNYYLLMINMGEAYMLQGDIKNAESYYNKGAEFAEKYDHEYSFENLLIMLADFYKSVDNHKKASYYFEKFAKKKKVPTFSSMRLEESHDKNKLRDQMIVMRNLREKNDILLKRIMQLHDELNHDRQYTAKNKILEEDLIKGLQNDEIVAFYQLKWSNSKDRPIGAEALIRWIKDGNIVPPGAFISEIESSSIIIDVSKRVITDSMRVCKKLVDEYDPDFMMSVNIAPYQLLHQNLAKFIEGELLIHKLPARNFEIEITERSFIDSNPKITEELYAIKDLGVSIALDDFGTGYSSLSCINDLPINSVKIDKSLIMNSETDVKTALLLNGIIALMNNLKMEIVIEGVEHKNQVELLKSYNCDYLQGYYFSKPIKEEDFVSSMMSYIK